MVNLQFKATENFKAYSGKGVAFVDGEIKKVPKEVADYLLKTFPENFSKVTVEEIEVDESTGSVVETAPDKMVTATKPKGQKRKSSSSKKP